ncbi:hypothetical protein FK531_12380 [Rhodococcus spelaei]|uniref:Integral membrane protein n=1 Tax=Rhodococcus spelaei TaxID=2546320 RepID=A0A541B8G6_9NOCA|nr:hypothetical protein [Rhodococcus spelaei]TQF68610.1 hypothetical protein FK531_12380 [Rhodococcus spelaei]
MNTRVLRVAEACLAVAAVVLAAWCWHQGVQTSDFAPLAEGAPAFSGTHYSGTWIGAATALIVVAGLLVIDVIRRRRTP